MKLVDFKYHGIFFDADFDEEGKATIVMMAVGTGFVVDAIDVTEVVSDELRAALEVAYAEHRSLLDPDHVYESWRDNKVEGA